MLIFVLFDTWFWNVSYWSDILSNKADESTYLEKPENYESHAMRNKRSNHYCLFVQISWKFKFPSL